MKPIVAILAQGTMGAGIARRLTENGVEVRTSLAGRSAGSARRAKAAGMIDATEAQLAEADFFFSIVPPGDALALVQRLTPAFSAANRKPVYVDCNAVNTETARRIDTTVSQTGAPFVDGGIIGGPPHPLVTHPNDAGPRLYVAGPNADRLLRLREYGLDIRVLSGPPDAASALKMSYAGITKGFTALGSIMLLAAVRTGTAPDLYAELADSQKALLGWLNGSIPRMYDKAYRWVAEMEEISGFVGKNLTDSEVHSAFAKFYARMADDNDGRKEEIGMLSGFLKTDAKP
ncbi:MAG: NAD(P)-dependent oxidoreductase [Acetobacteraceae bacterium]|nr:NAD(P)-dependent oxidoreductase [Acetobacteraceae bacterium]